MRYVEFMKKVVPMHDDLFDFFYEALPGYEMVGNRRIMLGCWGSFQDPEYCNFAYRDMTEWGRKMFVTPGSRRRRGARHDRPRGDQPRHPDPAGQLLLRGLGGPGDLRDAATRWATRSTAGTRGTSTPTRGRRSATSTTSTAG